jgi:hypothetical protein
MKKYTALRTIASIFKILGIISMVITILLSLGSCLFFGFVGTSMNAIMYNMTGSSGDSAATIIAGIITGLIVLIYGGFSSLMIYGAGELIYVLLDIEQNTRESSELLRISARSTSSGA